MDYTVARNSLLFIVLVVKKKKKPCSIDILYRKYVVFSRDVGVFEYR